MSKHSDDINSFGAVKRCGKSICFVFLIVRCNKIEITLNWGESYYYAKYKKTIQYLHLKRRAVNNTVFARSQLPFYCL